MRSYRVSLAFSFEPPIHFHITFILSGLLVSSSPFLRTELILSFHTYDYARHFLSSCTRILGLETMPNGIEHEGRYTQVGTFPIGIDPMQFVDGIREEGIVKRLQALKARFKGCKVSMLFDLIRVWWGVWMEAVGKDMISGG